MIHMPTIEGLSQETGIPVPCLIRYILVKYAASNADILLATGPLVLHQMEQQIAAAEADGSPTTMAPTLFVGDRVHAVLGNLLAYQNAD
jgi:hypothetical protein